MCASLCDVPLNDVYTTQDAGKFTSTEVPLFTITLFHAL